MAITSKGRGKSGGARVITFAVVIAESEGILYLIDIYDKSEFESIDNSRIRKITNELLP